MSVDGTPKFGSLIVKEITAEINGMAITLTGKAAFVDKENNATHGWTKGEGAVWSQETKDQLMVLQRMMEVDLARLHFTDVYSPGESRTPANSEPNLGGIGEHLDDADQV